MDTEKRTNFFGTKKMDYTIVYWTPFFNQFINNNAIIIMHKKRIIEVVFIGYLVTRNKMKIYDFFLAE